MSEEILNILASVKPGIEIKMMTYKRTVMVTLKYDPFVVGIGPTLFLATKDCLNWLLEVVEEKPQDYSYLTPMFKRLYEVL